MSPLERFFAAYDAVLARWPVAVETIDIPSQFGTTRVNACGPADAPPLVLLPGGGATSTAWFANVADLSRDRRVYAADILGDAGRGIHNGRGMTTLADLMTWLDGLFDHLGLDRADLCGHSYSGWIALNYALHAPGRVNRLALLDPTACFTRTAATYILHALPLLAGQTEARMRAFLTWEIGDHPVDAGWLDVMARSGGFPKSKLIMPRRLRADQLRAADVPTLVLLAEHTRMHDIGRVAAAAHRLMPRVTTTVLPDTSHHSVPSGHPDRLNRALIGFYSAAPAV